MGARSGSVGALSQAFSALRDEGRAGTHGPPELAGGISDAQLIALARESQGEALELIYATYKGRIFTFLARLLSDPDTADDVCQDVFTKAYRLLPTLTNEHRVLPWLYRVANNAAIDHLRRRRRFTWLHIGGLGGTSEEPRSPAEHERLPEIHHVQTVLRTLPPENSTALLLHALEGYSYKEIAEIQGCSLTAVRSRIARARLAFRKEYEGP